MCVGESALRHFRAGFEDPADVSSAKPTGCTDPVRVETPALRLDLLSTFTDIDLTEQLNNECLNRRAIVGIAKSQDLHNKPIMGLHVLPFRETGLGDFGLYPW